jgi:hypothetical protein
LLRRQSWIPAGTRVGACLSVAFSGHHRRQADSVPGYRSPTALQCKIDDLLLTERPRQVHHNALPCLVHSQESRGQLEQMLTPCDHPPGPASRALCNFTDDLRRCHFKSTVIPSSGSAYATDWLFFNIWLFVWGSSPDCCMAASNIQRRHLHSFHSRFELVVGLSLIELAPHLIICCNGKRDRKSDTESEWPPFKSVDSQKLARESISALSTSLVLRVMMYAESIQHRPPAQARKSEGWCCVDDYSRVLK